ncbi:NADPH--cytochrome reductase [Paenibacillus sp. CAA11]|uniref:bifunctional cytochrome P450/NADPH--P450 reductase n=1 Tax=Paenibacillus sp. CAA11 TaxID=1532905 RepID=UPI000D3826EF|nr:cytochrome P450 [Paenibacillus sp. CAA11]AWB44626.1 NADPH--cytochrome reductase [Paenibacillus sp. CAA11]
MAKNHEFIPQPKTYGMLGNIPLIDKDSPSLSLGELAREYGPIFRFERVGGESTIIITGHKLMAEVADETRFDKSIEGPLSKVRAFTGDGLFTSRTDEPNWRRAHNLLLPAFSQQAMKGYHSMMVDIALQLVQKWARLNSDDVINVPEDMTRLTLDTIGLCAFNYRFNSFYREQANPFIQSMVRALDEAMHQGSRLPIQNKLMVSKRRQFQHDIKSMFALADKLISDRREKGDQGETDLLARMLSVKNPETGETLDSENIRYQMITFLIAGHETTSGLLSFAIYFLLKHPEVLAKAVQEADEVITGDAPTYKEVTQLKYIRTVLNESLRLWPTAPGFSLYAKEDTVIGGKYEIKKGEQISIVLPELHRDKEAWGEDAEEFKPERFAEPGKIPAHAYKPFGNGQRACIGMQFALHEANLVLGMILKHFELLPNGDYQLKIKQTLTLKPDNFTIRVKLRSPQMPAGAETVLNADPKIDNKPARIQEPESKGSLLGINNRPLVVLYGSNMGTAQGVARSLADTASLHGVRSEVAALNDRVGKLPKEGALLIVASSYNGKPTTNAAEFIQWLDNLGAGELEGVTYSVFGCGDRNWTSTYQDVPRYIDEKLEQKGAKRFSPRGEGDASSDFEKQLEDWQSTMWADAIAEFGLTFNPSAEREKAALNIQFVSSAAGTPLAETYEAVHAAVLANNELQLEGSERSTRHIELRLPEEVSYQEGDHLGVLPKNSEAIVKRVLHRFQLSGNDHIVLTASGLSARHLPLGHPVRLFDLLSASVELQEPASRAQLRELASYTVCPPHKKELEAMLLEENYKREILDKRITMLDLLERYAACELPFERFLELLPPLRPRYYSISSSPKIDASQLSITVAVVQGPARSGQGTFKGVTSNYLAGLKPGEEVMVFVRTPESGFQLPEDPEVPIIMVGPGTGVAPFRGFLQARHVLKQQGRSLGKAHLYFGCRNDQDFIYRKELNDYQEQGLVTLHTAFSRGKGLPKVYVQHLMEQDAEQIIRVLDQGGRLYICGDGSAMAPDVEATLRRAYSSVHGADEQAAREWLNRLQANGYYAKDVWAGI